VAEQAGLDVLGCEGLAQQGVVEQVDLTHGQVVRRAPPGVDPAQLLVVEGAGRAAGGGDAVGAVGGLLDVGGDGHP